MWRTLALQQKLFSTDILLYLTTGITTSLKQFRVKADSAQLAAIQIFRESGPTPSSPMQGTTVNTVCVVTGAEHAVLPLAQTRYI